MNNFDCKMIKMAVESFVENRLNKWKEEKIHSADFLCSIAPVLEAYNRLENLLLFGGGKK